ncbi:hypothetical protein [Bacillus sp. WMMC1349]|nr:hypothetical protein [Bacillus sp. WMMC1349]
MKGKSIFLSVIILGVLAMGVTGFSKVDQCNNMQESVRMAT